MTMRPDGVPDRADRELARSLRSGDPEALEALFREHYERLVRTALRFTKDRSGAEDVVQDVFVTLWEGRHGLEIRSSLRAYLHRATRNTALNRARRSATEERFETRARSDPSLLEPVLGRGVSAGPALPTGGDEAGSRVMRALAALSPRRREAMVLRWLEGLSYREIAEVMGIAPKSVENELRRGLSDLRDILGEGPNRAR